MKVEAMFFDYDGTLSPINVCREESRIPSSLKELLTGLSKKTTIGVVTTKDFRFIKKRTCFAQILACIGGLEIMFKEREKYKAVYRCNNNRLYALKTLCKGIPNIFFVEEKRLSTGTVAGICVDWRTHSGPSDGIMRYIDDMKEQAKKSSLCVVQGKNTPFLDVYTSRIDKGKAILKIGEWLHLNLANCIYFGDSELDNSAFRRVGFSVGVLHNENIDSRLECSKLVRFGDLSTFLKDFPVSIEP